MTSADLPWFEELDLKGKRALVRVDFNVPLDGGKVADDSRLRAHLPTLQALLEKGASLVLASHLGRPKGESNAELSLAPVVGPLSKLLGREIRFAPDCVGPQVEAAARSLAAGEVLLLENLRFHKEEEANDEGFGKHLAALADLYVNDAFATAHRAHASVDAAARAAPQRAAGLLLRSEIEFLGQALTVPQRPLVAIIGGAKISSKIGVLRALVSKVDQLLIGGAMANTFLGALGLEMGASLVENDQYETAIEVLEAALDAGASVELPRDLVCSARGSEGGLHRQNVASNYLTPDLAAYDIGPHTRARFAEIIARAGTILWNGPLGLFENESFRQGTLAVAQAVANCRGLTIAGGGDTLAALNRLGLSDAIDHLSTGGGAFLEFIEGKTLPGMKALRG